MYYEKQAKQCQTFLHHPNIHKFILRFKEQLAHNPFLQVAIFIAIAALLAPILLFIIFAIISTTFVFIGFMIIQATVLAIGASILSFVLFCIISTIVIAGLFILSVYYMIDYTNRAFNLLMSKT
ncbi:hypothetical protein ALC62_09472 [Cyphomyrmex costatus]|uniref:Promethin-A n=2 Tax=Cyphomyrmex costatus TaxID=456900 RepID=A0A195CIG1_9HYME|nr:hypothetical protein ALC62_09472 [Cyphomyrmex costatus]